jgi:hypothetical protein
LLRVEDEQVFAVRLQGRHERVRQALPHGLLTSIEGFLGPCFGSILIYLDRLTSTFNQ